MQEARSNLVRPDHGQRRTGGGMMAGFELLRQIKEENAADEALASRSEPIECPIHGERIQKNSRGQISCPYSADGRGHIL